jgi:hypothetical protein
VPRCEYCFIGSAYNYDNDVLGIVLAVAPMAGVECQTDVDCPDAQLCTERDGLPCASGQTCFCHHPDQSRWKSVIAHEAGHQLQAKAFGPLGGGYEFACPDGGCPEGQPINPLTLDLLDPLGIAPMCSCDGVQSANALHCMQSVEAFSAAMSEGFGQFSAARAFNYKDNPFTGLPEQSCTFSYYKEVLGADELGLVDCDAQEGLCRSVETRELVGDPPMPLQRNAALPPVAFDCGTPFAWRDTFCPGDTTDALATEHDFLQFFWSIYTRGQRLTMDQIYRIFRSSCSESACTQANLSFCGVCNLEQLRWAAIAPGEPDTDNVVSLETGARLYFGDNTDGFNEFVQFARDHGITSDPN